LIKVFPVI